MKKVMFFAILLIVASCKPETGSLQQTKDYLNLTVILDLSDRIKFGHQGQKDQLIISELLDAFQDRQRQFGFQISKDRFSVAIADQRGAEVNVFGLGESLHIDMAERGMNKPEFDRRRERLLTALDTLYQAAIEGPTTGSDIWTFFRDKLPFHLAGTTDTTNFHNKLVILTDGYLHFDRAIASTRQSGTYMRNLADLRNVLDWEKSFDQQGLCMLANRLQDEREIEVLMLELTPKEPEINTNEMEILRKFWGCWFEAMEVEHQEYAKEENMAQLKKVVRRYLHIAPSLAELTKR